MDSLKEKIEKHYKEDGALSWLVCFCAFISNAVVLGISHSFGVAFGTVMKDFNASEANVAWIASVRVCIQYLSASLSSILAKKFGFAPIITIGVLILTTFYIISTTSRNVAIFTLHCGIFGGFGLGLIYTPCSVICSFYLKKRRPLATGIAMCGGGIGLMLMSEAMNFFNESYGWKSYVIICATMCPLCVLLAITICILPKDFESRSSDTLFLSVNSAFPSIHPYQSCDSNENLYSKSSTELVAHNEYRNLDDNGDRFR